MKRIVIIFGLLIATLSLQAQKLTVEKMEVAPMDLSASTQPRLDKNGNPCALVKVQLAMPGASFEGNVIGDSPFRQGEYWVYMSAGSYMLNIKHKSIVPLFVNFRDYNIKKVESKTTYVLTLLMPQAVIAGEAAQSKAKFKEMAAKGEPLVPDWYSTSKANHWIGVSPPSFDGEKARSAAIFSALLLYLRSAETARMKLSLRLKNTAIGAASEVSMNMADMISYEGFVFEIADEYYNSRGEYFVDCAIMPDRVDNKLIMSRQLEYKDHHGKSQKDHSSTGQAKVDIVLQLKEQVSKMSLECSVDENNDQYVLKVNDQRLIPVDDYSYSGYGESSVVTGNAQLVMTGDELRSSLGLARLTAQCVTPFVPRTADFNGRLSIRSEQTDDAVNSQTDLMAFVLADTTYYPSPLSFQLTKNGGMTVSYADVNFRDDDLNKKDVYCYRGWGSDNDAGATTLGQLINCNVDIANYLSVGAYELSRNMEPVTQSQSSSDDDSYYSNTITQNKVVASLTDIGVKWAFPQEKEAKMTGGVQNGLMVKMRETSNGQPVTMPEEELTIPEKRAASKVLSKALAKEIKQKIKELSMAGWQPFYSDEPIEQQLENFYRLLSQYDEENNPRYLSANALIKGCNNELLKIESTEQAKHSLFQRIIYDVSNLIDEKVEKQQMQKAESESLKKSMSVVYRDIFNSLGKAKTMLGLYRHLPDGNKEVEVSIVCSRDLAKKIVKEALRKELLRSGDKLYEKLDLIF